jgi:hypothetical protein
LTQLSLAGFQVTINGRFWVSTEVTDLLAITKLLTVFETYDSEADAVRSFTSASVWEGIFALAWRVIPNIAVQIRGRQTCVHSRSW